MGRTSALIFVAGLIVVVITLRHADSDSDHGWREEAEGLRQRFERTGPRKRAGSGIGWIRGQTAGSRRG
jgi:hypothetical protein